MSTTMEEQNKWILEVLYVAYQGSFVLSMIEKLKTRPVKDLSPRQIDILRDIFVKHFRKTNKPWKKKDHNGLSASDVGVDTFNKKVFGANSTETTNDGADSIDATDTAKIDEFYVKLPSFVKYNIYFQFLTHPGLSTVADYMKNVGFSGQDANRFVVLLEQGAKKMTANINKVTKQFDLDVTTNYQTGWGFGMDEVKQNVVMYCILREFSFEKFQEYIKSLLEGTK